MGAPPARSDDSALRRFFRVTGSLKCAVVLMFVFAAASLVGMYVESRTDAETARKWVYGNLWFNCAFALLWLNIFSATMVRYPWPKRLTGFVITHAGLLIIIIASLISRVWGVEGQMRLAEGQSSSMLLQQERRVLHVKLPNGRRYEVPERLLQTLNPDSPHRIGDSAWGFEVTEYLMRSRIESGYVRAPQGAPAAEVVVTGAQFGELPRWVLPAHANPRARRVALGMMSVDAQWLADAAALERFQAAAVQSQSHRGWFEVGEGETAATARIRLRLRDGSERMIAVADLVKGPVVLPGEKGVTVTLGQIVENAIVGTGPDGRSALVEAPNDGSGTGAGPAIEFSVTWSDGAEQHAAFAGMPEFHSRKGGHAAGEIQSRTVALGFTPEGGVWVRLHDERGDVAGPAEELPGGQSFTTPWNGITVAVRKFYGAARRHVALVDASSEETPRGEMALPGVRLNLYGPGGIESVWLQQHVPQSVHHADGPVQLEWSWGRYALDFNVKLIDFRKVDYPGTSRAASFESDVQVQDPLRGRNEKVTISMNYPMEHGGVAWWPGSDWAFFQSSYQQSPGAVEESIFSVAYDPGYALNMFGSILVIFGIFTMFYLVPYFRPKRKRRAAVTPAVGPPPEDAEGNS